MAQISITSLPILADLTDDDLILVVNDPLGTPTTRTVTGAVAKTFFEAVALARANHTGTQLAETILDLAEAIDDRVGTLLAAGTGISLSYDDTGNTLTITSSITQYTDEMARDALGTALVAGSGVTITPSDGADTITISATGSWDAEQTRDTIATALTAGTGITITPNDASDIITIAADGSATSAANISTVKQSSAVTATTNTFVDIPGLALAVTSGHRYFFQFAVTYQTAATTTGVSFDLSGPAMTSANFRVQTGGASTGVSFDYGQSSTTITDDLTSLNVDAANTDYPAYISGFITPSASGTVQLRGRSEVASSAVIFRTDGLGFLIDCDATTSSYTDEQARDAIATALVAGSGVTITPNDGADTITITASGTTWDAEQTRDTIATALTAGSGITITPNDGADTITIAASGSATSNPWDGAIVVASLDAPSAVRTAADYVCDGVADEVQINAAILKAAALNSRGGPVGGLQAGRVVLTGGAFLIENDPILMRTGVTLQGQGYLTELRANALNTAADDGGAGTGTAIIKAFDDDIHLCKIKDMWLNGNFGSGGDCHGIHLASSTSTGDRSAYPDSNPDPDIQIEGLFVSRFTTGTRHGIWIDTDLRGTLISDCQIRVVSGHGIYMMDSPDSHLSSIHIGGATLDGYRVTGGNVKLTNCKAYYCDGYGFNILSGRGALSACEAQDSARGFNFGSSPITATGIVADTSQLDGIVIDANRTVLSGFSVFHRASGRYAACTNGIRFVGTPTDCSITGVVNPADITNKVSGTTTGARNFIRISNGATLTSVG